MLRCAVTGATGWLGGRVVAALRGRGDAVRRLVRRPAGPDDRAFDLGAAHASTDLAGLDALVHCAHDFATLDPKRAWEVNARGGERLLRAAAAAGVARVVFVSTVSAFEGAASHYGQGKLHVERAAIALGAAVLRPGLLWSESPRGLVAALTRVARLPVVPVFDGGEQPLVTAHVDDVVSAVLAALDDPTGWPLAPVTAAHPRSFAFAELVRALAPRAHTPRIVSVPSALGLAALAVSEAAGIALPFRRDSLVSLLAPPPGLDFSLAAERSLRFRPFAPRADEVVAPGAG